MAATSSQGEGRLKAVHWHVDLHREGWGLWDSDYTEDNVFYLINKIVLH